MIVYYALHADHESSQIICQCRSGNKWLEALRAVLSLPTCSIFSLSVALATAWITEFSSQDPRNTETRRGFFGDVGMAFPKRLDCSLIQIRHHRTFHAACVFVFRASNFRKTPQITKKNHNRGTLTFRMHCKNNTYFHKRLYHCTQLQSSACLFRLSAQIRLFLCLCSIRRTWKNPASHTTTLTTGLQYCSSWWFQPIWKIWSSNWIIFPGTGENKEYLKPPPSVCFSIPNFVFRILVVSDIHIGNIYNRITE